jgi:hypothetical protein
VNEGGGVDEGEGVKVGGGVDEGEGVEVGGEDVVADGEDAIEFRNSFPSDVSKKR